MVNDSSAIMKAYEDPHDKSISSYSNLSGKSFSQKIGFIPKPPTESKKGIILDYMARPPTDPKIDSNTKIERFQFKK
jgi:hypothetical protein